MRRFVFCFRKYSFFSKTTTQFSCILADVMVVGGAESATSPITVAGFHSMKALSTRNHDPEAASRPWDVDRDGFVLGEGAGVLVIEEYERAKARGAKIYAEVTGFGMSADAYHITGPAESGEGGAAGKPAPSPYFDAVVPATFHFLN